jgi:hypothetical protein
MHTPATPKIEAYPVPEHARIGTLARHFGRHMLRVENRVYDFMSQFARSYCGGLWQFVELSNGGFYMMPPDDMYDIRIVSNGFRGHMSADAAGITVCLFTYSHLSFEYSAELFARHCHWLREFALGHHDAGLIMQAID